MKKAYQIVDPHSRKALKAVEQSLIEHGQVLLPMVELIENGRLFVQEFMDSVSRVALHAVIELSVQGIAGPAHQGRRGGEVLRHGKQRGRVCLATHQLQVEKPRLRERGGREVRIPVYAAMQAKSPLMEQLSRSILHGVSTRNYEKIVPQMAEACGVSKSSVSREFVEASAQQLEALCARRFHEFDILIVYIDGVRFGDHQCVGAIGVDGEGQKHVLGVAEGATENEVVVTGLLEDLVERGLDPSRRRLFVIDGSKALRAGIDRVFGKGHPVQRCRHHKIENVMGYLSRELRPQIKAVMKAAYKLEAKAGIAKLKQQAQWLQTEYPSAASSLLEGLEETFTVNRLDLPAELRRCLSTTNIIESPTSGVRLRTRRVTHWQSGEMVLRWAAATLLETEKNFRRIMGYKQLWMLRAALDHDAGNTFEEVKAA